MDKEEGILVIGELHAVAVVLRSTIKVMQEIESDKTAVKKVRTVNGT